MSNVISHAGLPAGSLQGLADATAALVSSLDLDAVLDQIARAARDVTRAEASSVLLHDRRRRKLIFAAAVGDHAPFLIGEEFSADLGIAGLVLRTGQAEWVQDVSARKEFYAEFDRRASFRTRELLAAPMIYKSEVVGVIEVLNTRDAAPFGAGDLELLKVFANLAACSTRNAQRHETLRRENVGLRETVLAGVEIIGDSLALRRMLDLAHRVARTNATVLLLGETGTGKEVLAKYIHSNSDRHDKTFVGVNCAALTETLLESELFGHEKGAFTGAAGQRVGRFELADHGTLFLDEIGDISLSTQVKLLRVLQEREFMRVGGTRTIACDVRIIAATNRDLKRLISEGRFRDDLFYRLNVFPILMPPLRDRREDIPSLADRFARRACVELGVPPRTLSPDAVALLMSHPWPGNIRELANVIERAVLMSDGAQILPQHLPADLLAGAAPPASPDQASILQSQERALVLKALNECGWNQVHAARALGISRDNLRYRIKKYGLHRPAEASWEGANPS
ncbi:MAG: sigma 54-interacting transcriptional regulator [Phycisphaerae bacterium]|nr:MAG: GAF domain-containing protein [Planctomycetota bacterium]KAB2949831.1 MAG: GAF domain-containing protein [Phycisphaerae bacterium]MBE7456963.1 sigma 54-interacting transcriptional regulator [Planctomycetia bacterium]MCK6463678.1 sigma 54-interacting transcriptional regulator [Phycisphaerae bacterium]MCL4718347.1 sigma 54-interacting transcriptional regulator [Phycisphaerae bacterium]